MSSFFRSIAPLALSFIAPGLGTAIGSALGAGATFAPIVGNAALGAGMGAATGGGLKGAAIGGITGGLAGGGGELLAGQAGLTGTAAKSFGGALAGGTSGALSGNGLEGALTGAVLGGAMPYVSQAIDGFVNPQTTIVNGKTVPLPQAKPLPPTAIGSLTTGSQPMKLGQLIGAGSDLLGYSQGQDDLEEMQRMYQQATQRAKAQMQPYSQAGQQALQNLQQPNMEALQNDPAYQFQLQQGREALERSLAAQGMGQSGAAMKQAQEYGQGLANQQYGQFFDRNFALANQGQQAATGLGSIIGQGASADAMARAAMINNRNQAMSNLFGTYDDERQILSGSLGQLLGRL